MKRYLLAATAAFAALLASLSSVSAGEEAYGVALGAMTCGESTCHSASVPWPNSSVSQREFVVWSERDPHAKSYATLQTPRARSIAAAVGQGEPTKSTKCLGCHAYTPAEAEETHRVEDGVSCEACHGAASAWLGVHSSGLYFYGENIENGMYPTTDATARAEL